MAKRATISDVAREAGVAKSTVSAVLNNKKGVGNATRARILDVCERLNYRPSGPARHRVSTGSGRAIGLVIKELDNPYFTEVAAGAFSEGRKHGFALLMASSEGDYEAEKDAVELLCEKGVDGLIINPVLNNDSDLSHLYELKRRNLPFVLLEEIRGVKASLIDIENVAASRTAVEHLLEQGHRRIVHFAGPEHSTHASERIEGVHLAFSHSVWSVPENAIVPAGSHPEDGYRVGLEYFRGLPAEERPTAVTCYNDMVAIGLLRALAELGLRVPDDVSVIGFDDLQLLTFFPQGLTSVHVPTQEMGRRSAEMLIRHIQARESLPYFREFLTGQLMVRGSTRAITSQEAAASAE